jgi:hypothetical protein
MLMICALAMPMFLLYAACSVSAPKRFAGELREEWLQDRTPDNATAPAPDPTTEDERGFASA